MTGQDGLRDELIDALVTYQPRGVTSGGVIKVVADDIIDNALLPVVQARIDAAREQVAEQIAQAIEAEGAEPDVDDECSPVSVRHGLGLAARIARQHAKGGTP